MSTVDDPLPGGSAPDRVAYATGMLLDAEDFRAEQAYHRGRLARALAYLHGHGTVAGLRVVHDAEIAPGVDPGLPQGREERLRVQPGLAIDRVGRLVEFTRPKCVRLDRWYRGTEAELLRRSFHGPPRDGVVADVFVRFAVCERGKTPAFATGPFDSLDAVRAARLRDAAEVFLVPRPASVGLPQPGRPWPGLGTVAPPGRRAALNEAILGAWRDGSEFQEDGMPDPLPEHAGVGDTTSVFLARVLIPATAATGGGDERPQRNPGASVSVDNSLRPFIYGAGALATWLLV